MEQIYCHQFHITSLNLINPSNKADEFETIALRSFEEEGHRFRYMAPLYVEQSCLECHGYQNYEVGDVRGGISVQFDITDVKVRMDRQRFVIILLCIVSGVALIGIIYFLTLRLFRMLKSA